MDVDALIARVKNMIMQPVEEWNKIHQETKTRNDILLKYAVPLITLSTISVFLGNAFLTYGSDIVTGMIFAIIHFASILTGIILSAIIINELAKNFGSETNIIISYKLVIYSYTAYFVASILANLHDNLAFIHLFSLYSFYLLWLGVSALIKISDDKKVGFVIITVLVIFVISILVTAIFNIIAAPFLTGTFFS